MPACLLIDEAVSDRQSCATYIRQAEQVIARYDGRILAGAGPVAVPDGWWTPAQRQPIVVIPSAAQARTFYNSPEYGTARAMRHNAAITPMLLVDGLPL